MTARVNGTPYSIDVIDPNSRMLERHEHRFLVLSAAIGAFENRIRSLELLSKEVEVLRKETVQSTEFQVLLEKVEQVEKRVQLCMRQIADIQQDSHAKLAQRVKVLERALEKQKQVSVESLWEELQSLQISVRDRESNTKNGLVALELRVRQLSTKINQMPTPVAPHKKKETSKRINGDDVTLLEENLKQLRGDLTTLQQEFEQAVRGLGTRISGIEIAKAKPATAGTAFKESSSIQGAFVTGEEVSRIDEAISSYIQTPEEKENFGFALYDQLHKKLEKPSKDILEEILRREEQRESTPSVEEAILFALNKKLSACSQFHKNIQGYVIRLKREEKYLLFRSNIGGIEYVTMFCASHADSKIQNIQNCWNQPDQKFLWIDVSRQKRF